VDWRGALTENWGYKLAALVIVFLLWISLTADERVAQPIATRVRFDVQDTAWVLVEAPEEVSTTFQGRNRDLFSLALKEPELVVPIRDVQGPEMRVPLDASQVQFDSNLDVRPTVVVPSAADLRFERHAARTVPVVPEVEAMPAVGYTVLRPITVEPESVIVRGPSGELERITQVSTRQLSLKDLENPVLRDVALQPPPGVPGVQLDPTSVLVTVSVDSLVMRTVQVPVRAVGAGARGVRLGPDSVEAVIRGAASVVRRLQLTTSQAIVRIPEGLVADTVLPVELATAADTAGAGLASIAFSPPLVQVTRGSGR
jgi:YbbR domain-containing protein